MEVDISTVLAGGPPRPKTQSEPAGPAPLPPAPPNNITDALKALTSGRSTPTMTTPTTFERTADGLSTARIHSSAANALVAALQPPATVDAHEIDVRVQELLGGGSLPERLTPDGVDLRRERDALVTALLGFNLGEALRRAEHYLECLNTYLADGDTAALKPFAGYDAEQPPSPAVVQEPPVPPTPLEQAQQAYGAACYIANLNHATGEPHLVVDGDTVHLRLRLPDNSPILHTFTRNLEHVGLRFDNGDD